PPTTLFPYTTLFRSLHKTFGVSSELGLTNVLLETADLSAALKTTGVPGLEVLPCGPLPPNPSELLHTERFHNLLAALDERYDRRSEEHTSELQSLAY